MLYADKLLSYVKSINDPIKTTSTTTAKSNEGLDLSSILTMLMMSQMFKKPGVAGVGALDSMPSPASYGSVPNTLGSGAVPGLQNQSGVEGILQALASMGPLFGR